MSSSSFCTECISNRLAGTGANRFGTALLNACGYNRQPFTTTMHIGWARTQILVRLPLPIDGTNSQTTVSKYRMQTRFLRRNHAWKLHFSTHSTRKQIVTLEIAGKVQIRNHMSCFLTSCFLPDCCLTVFEFPTNLGFQEKWQLCNYRSKLSICD